LKNIPQKIIDHKKSLTKAFYYLVIDWWESHSGLKIVKEDIVNISSTRINVTYTFDADEVTAKKESIVDELCKGANVAGFRKGKVPRNIILSKFRDSIKRELDSNFVNKSLEALNSAQSKWIVVSVDEMKRDDADGEVVCSFVVEAIPDFEPADYKTISIAPIAVEVSESEVDDEIRNLLRKDAEYEAVDREVRERDFVKLSYAGRFEDGTEVASIGGIPAIYGSQGNTWEEAGNASVGVRAIVDGLIGTKAGDKISVTQKFESDFEVHALAGKVVNYDVEIIEVRECVLPEITETLLESFSVKTEEELRSSVRTSLLNHKTSQARFTQRNEIVDKLCELTEMEIPAVAVDREATNLMNEFTSKRISEGARETDMKSKSQEIFNAFKPAAAKRVKIGAILDKIAKSEHIEITTEDVEAMIWQDVYAKKLDVNHYVTELKSSASKIADIRRRALHGKTLDRLMMILCEDLADEAARKKVDAEREKVDAESSADGTNLEENAEQFESKFAADESNVVEKEGGVSLESELAVDADGNESAQNADSEGMVPIRSWRAAEKKSPESGQGSQMRHGRDADRIDRPSKADATRNSAPMHRYSRKIP
jgi:trigger factor